MTSIAERLAPHLSSVLQHPGDPDNGVEPHPVAPLPVFQNQATLPKGMAEEEAQKAGLPHADFALLYTETWIELIRVVEGIDLNDPDLKPERQAELHAELKMLREATNGRNNAMKQCKTECGQPAYRMMVRDFNTDEPIIPCAAAPGHECTGSR